MAPDTGQSPAEEQGDRPEEPQAAATASTSSPTANNNNSSNYNLVTSLLNLTKSPVSNPPCGAFGVSFLILSRVEFVRIDGWMTCIVSVLLRTAG